VFIPTQHIHEHRGDFVHHPHEGVCRGRNDTAAVPPAIRDPAPHKARQNQDAKGARGQFEVAERVNLTRRHEEPKHRHSCKQVGVVHATPHVLHGDSGHDPFSIGHLEADHEEVQDGPVCVCECESECVCGY
jgi:hypothetical protein